VVCDSQHDHDLFHPIAPARKLTIIPNGVDMGDFLTLVKEPEPGLLLGIGRLAENKGVERIVPLLAAWPQARLVWIGQDVDGRRPGLLALAQAHGVADRVTLLGRVSPTELRGWLARAWLFVSAATYEAFGLSTIEAMSSGTVPLVTPVGVHPEVVQDGETGFLWRFDDDVGAVAALRRALSLPRLDLLRLGEAARRAVAPFAWERVAERYLELYQRVGPRP
jgi:alpha-1,3-mannosyltransferase